MAGALEKIDAILSDLEKLTGHSSFCSGKPRFTLGYWKLGGLAQPARVMLVYGGHCNYENATYQFGPPPENSRADWMDVKFTMNLDFPNLPYLIDQQHGLRITESQAILRYLARELNIGSKDSQGIAREEMVADVVRELFTQWAKINYSKDFDQLKGPYVKDLPASLKPLESFLKERKWLGGNDLCYADFLLFEFLNISTRFCPDVYESFSELTRFHKAFKALQPLQDYFKSDVARYPASGPAARFQ